MSLFQYFAVFGLLGFQLAILHLDQNFPFLYCVSAFGAEVVKSCIRPMGWGCSFFLILCSTGQKSRVICFSKSWFKTHFKNVWATCWDFGGRFLSFSLVLFYSSFYVILESMVLNYIFLRSWPFYMYFQIYRPKILPRIVFRNY